MSGERQSVIITTIIGGGLESSSRSLPFLFIAKKRDGAVQQRGLMSRFYSFWGTFSERKNGIAYLFSAPAGRDARTAQAVRPDGRKVSRRTSAGSAPSADGGDVAVPAAGAKRKGHLRFPFLFELLSFPYSDSTAAIRERRPLRNRGTAVGLLLRRNAHYASITRPIRSSRMPFCYTYRQLYADATQGELPEGQEKVPWGITVSRNSLARYYR